jgi:hypothetical protein
MATLGEFRVQLRLAYHLVVECVDPRAASNGLGLIDLALDLFALSDDINWAREFASRKSCVWPSRWEPRWQLLHSQNSATQVCAHTSRFKKDLHGLLDAFQNNRWPYVDIQVWKLYIKDSDLSVMEKESFHIPCFTHFRRTRGPLPCLSSSSNLKPKSKVRDKQTGEPSLVIIQHDRETERRISLK